MESFQAQAVNLPGTLGLANGTTRLVSVRAIAKPACARRLDNLGEGARQTPLVAHERQAAQARGIGNHAGVARQRHHHACDCGVTALIVALTHATGGQRIVAQQRIEQR